MEIKLKTAPGLGEMEIIVDEFGASWNPGPKVAQGISLATTRGLDGEPISAYYRDGTLFIVNLSDAKRYFGKTNPEKFNEM